MQDLIYNEIVATPGYELDFAVGTTYSLDAEAYLAIALSLARLGDATETDFLKNPSRLLEGLRRTNKRIALFCNRAGMLVPSRTNSLNAMLDRSVFEVADQNDALSNFHPKIWVIKERLKENRTIAQLKLIVMSRNLTKDSSLDVAVALTAQFTSSPSPELQKKHAPLKDFLLRLAPFASPEKKKRIESLAEEIDHIDRFLLQQPYEDYDFLPLSFGDNLNPDIDIKTDFAGEKMLIVSPFIDKTPTRFVNGAEEACPVKWMTDFRESSPKVLITRYDSLTPEILRLFNRDNREVWVLNQVAEQNDVQPIALHAKMYFSWAPKSFRDGIYYWLGSANATHTGFYRNSEFMLRLSMRLGHGRFEDFKKEFCNEKKSLCERITSLPDFEPATQDRSLEIQVKSHLLKKGNLLASVKLSEGSYEITVKALTLKTLDARIFFSPLQAPNIEAELNRDTHRCEMMVPRPELLSEFYIVKIMPNDENRDPLKYVIKINTRGIPADRDDCIFRSWIRTPDEFLNYIEMMISDTPAQMLLNMLDRESKRESCTQSSRFTANRPIYESLLRLAATDPDSLTDIQDFASKFGETVVPDSFKKIFSQFKPFKPKRRK